jgi:hypothetical protein
VGVLGGGGGWKYSCMGSLHFRDSERSFAGRKGNLSINICMVNGLLLCWMKVYSSLWMVLGGLIMFWFVCRKCVYGCVDVMCLSGGFCSEAIRSSIIVVQSGSGVCISIWLHVSMTGLIVVMSAYNIRGGGWC